MSIRFRASVAIELFKLSSHLFVYHVAGDELYQAGQDVNSTGTSVDKSMEDTRKNSLRVNRVESKDGRHLELRANFNIHCLDKAVFGAA